MAKRDLNLGVVKFKNSTYKQFYLDAKKVEKVCESPKLLIKSISPNDLKDFKITFHFIYINTKYKVQIEREFRTYNQIIKYTEDGNYDEIDVSLYLENGFTLLSIGIEINKPVDFEIYILHGTDLEKMRKAATN